MNDVFLRLFLINDIDTNLISIFVPEIYNQESQFVVLDDDGKIRKEKTFPCEININVYEEAPRVEIKKEYLRLYAMMIFNIKC